MNLSSFLGRDDLTSVFKSMEWNSKMLDSCFDSMDLNKDGKISFEGKFKGYS